MFQLSDVPANPQVAAKTLSQMARRDPRVERITKGWYLRVGEPDPAVNGQWDLPGGGQ